MESIAKEGVNYPVLKADKNGRVLCPFCQQRHKHGRGGGNGHRVADCGSSPFKESVCENGIWFHKSNGYYVVFEP